MNVYALFIRRNLELFKRLGITLLMMTITRFVFYFANITSFKSAVFYDFIAGIWMDAITIGIYFIPFYAFSLLPFPFYTTKWYQRFLKGLFHLTNSVIIALNLIDVEYYKYTAKRSTADLYTMVTEDNNMNELAWAFVVDFWWIFLLFAALVYLSNHLYNKTLYKKQTQFNWGLESFNFLLIASALFIIGRGGFGFRPADMLTAAKLTSPTKIALVANTPLSIIKTIGKEPLELKSYFPENNKYIYNPIRKGTKEHQIQEDVNVMVIILESFGNEWLGKKTGGPFTPFLDSLIDESLYFDNAFANGKKSIEAVPSIFASIPGLTDNPYISSVYGTNKINSLPELLKEQGYSSGFYHGATNGSMKFDVFAAHLGFEKYFGRTEFNDESKSDNNWGILDEYFLPWTAQSITKELKEPFIAGLFTLSSHHPYFVPEEYKDILPEGEHPIAKSIAYADYSLKLFFEEAKKQDWYENTVFLITADHTPTGHKEYYTHRAGMFEVPIILFDPMDRISAGRSSDLFNHMDILPTLLDLTGFPNDVYSFGNSHCSNEKESFAINHIENTHLYYKDEYLLYFLDDKPVGLYNFKKDSLLHHDSTSYYPDLVQEMENLLKGFIQRYNQDLIQNTMTLDEED